MWLKVFSCFGQGTKLAKENEPEENLKGFSSTAASSYF